MIILQASCRECKEPSHIPLKCSEVEKKGETAFRLRVEELMTKALVRECSKCRTELIKDAGCNKVGREFRRAAFQPLVQFG
jgi:TRIAD3 protein (E3 ubiquitin-protein ligase RNF216)